MKLRVVFRGPNKSFEKNGLQPGDEFEFPTSPPVWKIQVFEDDEGGKTE